MQTNEETLNNIVQIMDNYINKGSIFWTAKTTLNEIQTLLEENYIHGSLDNDYK
jgi:hypothetical protein